MSTEPQEKKPRVLKWAKIADEARARCAAKGWTGQDVEFQLAREIVNDPELLRQFRQSARGRPGRDRDGLRHRLLREVKRMAPDPKPSVFQRVRSWALRLLRRHTRKTKPLAA